MRYPCIDHEQKGNPDGYGFARHNGKHIGLHRYVFLQAYGYLPPVVRHKCNNPRCVNPLHLLPGTVRDNTMDRVLSGHHTGGHKRKLDADALRLIHTSDKSCYALSKELGVSSGVVWRVRNGKTYRGE